MGLESIVAEFVGEAVLGDLVSSVVLDSGAEFLSDGFSGGFDFGGFENLQSQVGDFAGNADWFDSNYFGDIVDAPGLTDNVFDFNTSDFSISDFNFGDNLQVDSYLPSSGVTFDSPFQIGPDSTFTGGVFTSENFGFDGPLTTGAIDVVGPPSPFNSNSPGFVGPPVPPPTNFFDTVRGAIRDPAFIQTVSTVFPQVAPILSTATTVAGASTTANRNTLPTGENTVGPPSPFDPRSPEFTGPPAPPANPTFSPAIVNAAISAITGVNVNQVIALKNSPTPVSIDQVLGVLPNGGTNILSAGGNPVLGGAVVVPPLAISSITNNTSGYNSFTLNPNATTATAFAPAAVNSGDQLAGLQISQLVATTGDANFKVDINGVGVLTQDAARVTGLNEQARQQQTARIQTQNAPRTGDWRVRLSLADGSRYLYNAANAGDQARTSSILAPLWNTNGVIFPYTPQINTSYRANYDNYDLIHSNYRGYFYKNSYVDAISIRANFTAQDTAEANYLLAVIHFFRTVTKMFYGQDAERGSPPPLTFLTGLGDFQFNMHPCVVSNFEYELPDDVDYIRAQVTSNNGTNLLAARNRSTGSSASPGGALTASLIRMISAKLTPGAESGPVPLNTFGTASPDATYVPTKMNINLTLLPIQSRSQVSQLFSVKDFAAGNLLKGGFW